MEAEAESPEAEAHNIKHNPSLERPSVQQSALVGRRVSVLGTLIEAHTGAREYGVASMHGARNHSTLPAPSQLNAVGASFSQRSPPILLSVVGGECYDYVSPSALQQLADSVAAWRER